MNSKSEPINWYGTYTLTAKEVKRFLRVYHQTIVAPTVSALIFLAVFVLALGEHVQKVGEVNFTEFMAYGLIIMTIVQNAFANTSSSLIMSKVIGYVADILVPPFSGIELIIAFTLGAVCRGVLVGCVVALCLCPIVDFKVYHLGSLIFFTFFSCTLLGMLGILTGLIARSFEESAAITSYLITPLSFLSGTFYSIDRLPNFLKIISQFNPFFYMIDGFRYALTNHSDSNIDIGMVYLLSTNIIIFLLVNYLLNIGWRIKG